MKLIFTFFALFLVNNIYSQTKQETIDWINQKFKSSPFLQSKLQDGRVVTTETRFLEIKNDGSFQIDCNTYYASNVQMKEPDSKCTITGNFKNLSVNSLTTKTKGDNLLIYANCNSGDCMKQINDDGTVYNTSYTLIGLIDISTDKSLVDRCKKAFLHLIKLSGGKSEAF